MNGHATFIRFPLPVISFLVALKIVTLTQELG